MDDDAIDSIAQQFTDAFQEQMERPTLELLVDTIKDNKENGTIQDFVDELMHQDELLLVGVFQNDAICTIAGKNELFNKLGVSVFTGICISSDSTVWEKFLKPGMQEWSPEEIIRLVRSLMIDFQIQNQK